MTKKEILRVIAFCLIACVMMVLLCDLYEHENNTKQYDTRFNAYRHYPEDTIDAVYIGTSGVDRYWLASKAYDDYGMTVYPLSTDAMPAWLYINVIEYAMTYQNPELLILDARAFCQDNDAADMSVGACRVLDAMQRGSRCWFATAFKTMEQIHTADNSLPRFDISYLFSFIRFHSRWAEADYSFEKNIGNIDHPYNGFFVSPTFSTRVTPQEPYEYDASLTAPLAPLSEAALYDVLEYCKSQDMPVLFVFSPQFFKDSEMSRTNTILNILQEEGVPYVSYYTEENGPFALDLDPAQHFYNTGHVNYYGAQIYTDAFAAYLDANYDLPDRRNDEAVKAHWDGVYAAIDTQIQEMETAAAAEE